MNSEKSNGDSETRTAVTESNVKPPVATMPGRNGGRLNVGGRYGNKSKSGQTEEFRRVCREAVRDRQLLTRLAEIAESGAQEKDRIAATTKLAEWGWVELKQSKVELTGAAGGPVEQRVVVEYVDREIEGEATN